MGGEVRCQFSVKPKSTGERTLCVMFDSKELEDVDGMLTVTVAAVGEYSPAAPPIEAALYTVMCTHHHSCLLKSFSPLVID